MIFVSDTTPVHYLILIGQVHMLQELYGGVVAPQAVFDEMQRAATPAKVSSIKGMGLAQKIGRGQFHTSGVIMEAVLAAWGQAR